MNPAYSIILFSTASGTGYGMLAAAGLLAALGGLPPGRLVAWAVLVPALALVTAGLLASTAHLGRPERAWRAFSQWRTSWLSREGVAALATYLAATPFALGWALPLRAGPGGDEQPDKPGRVHHHRHDGGPGKRADQQARDRRHAGGRSGGRHFGRPATPRR